MTLEDWQNEGVPAELAEVGRQMVEEIRASMPFAPDASAPGEAPHSHTGRLLASVNHYVVLDGERWTLVVEAFTAYAGYLEYGTSRVAPRPFLSPVLERWRDQIPGRLLTSLATG
jgi:hypothetical protein